MSSSARLFHCLGCQRQVIICRQCDRGQNYCAQGCAQRARQASLRQAGRRYQQSFAGRVKHALRQRRYRQKQNQKKEIVTHHTSKQTQVISCSSHHHNHADNTVHHCHFCGALVTAWLRTDFLQGAPVRNKHYEHRLRRLE